MTKVSQKIVRCAKCGKESEQLIVYSVNFLLGDSATNEGLMNHKQKCPYCGYEAYSIDKLDNNETNYDISPDDNDPIELYGVPEYMDDYEIDEERNQPQCLYGPPEFFQRKKEEYEVKPEDNVPQKVYGVPFFRKEKESEEKED